MEADYFIRLKQEVPVTDFHSAFTFAHRAICSLYGAEKVSLEDPVRTKMEEGHCWVDRTSEVGESFARIFIGEIKHSFGEEVFTVERIRKRKRFE